MAIPAATTDTFSMYLGYESKAAMSVPSPDRLTVTGLAMGNQQLRVDILKAGAPIRSLESRDILQTIYATTSGSPEELEPTLLTADLSAFAGQTVTIRVANVSEDNSMWTTVDGVSILSTPIPTVTPPAPPAPAPPSNEFIKGALHLNKKNGTGWLSVTLPDAGVLTATDANRNIAHASFAGSKGKMKPILIKTATVTSAAAGTVKVPIKPTPAGMKLLEEKGMLAFHARLTFAPTGGTSATQPFKGKLQKQLGPAKR